MCIEGQLSSLIIRDQDIFIRVKPDLRYKLNVMSFFILTEVDKNKESVNCLAQLIKEAGYDCQTSLEKKEMKDHLESNFIILFLNKQSLRDTKLVNKFQFVLSRKLKHCVVLESDVDKGAVLTTGDLAILNIDAILKDPKSQPKARKALNGVSVLPFRTNKPFANFALKRILNCFDLKKLPETELLINKEILSNIEVKPSVDEVYQKLNAVPPKTVINFLGFTSNENEENFCQKFFSDLKGKLPIASHKFDISYKNSQNSKICLEEISRQLNEEIPEFIKGFGLPTYNTETLFSQLLIKPCNRIQRRKNLVFIIFRNLHNCVTNEANTMLHLLQTTKLPKWIRIIITSSNKYTKKWSFVGPIVNTIYENKTKDTKDKRWKEFINTIEPSIDPKKLLHLCNAISQPIPIKILSKVYGNDILNNIKTYGKSSILQVLGTDYVKINNWNEPNVDLTETHKTWVTYMTKIFETGGDKVNTSFCLSEFILQCVGAKDFKTLFTYLMKPNWLLDRTKEGVLSLYSNLKLARNILSKEDSKSELFVWIDTLVHFYQQTKEVLYRDYRELPSQLLGYLQPSLKKNHLVNTVKDIQFEGMKSFLPLMSSLSSLNGTKSSVNFDTFTTENKFHRVTVTKVIESFVCAGTDEGECLIYGLDGIDIEPIKSIKLHTREITSISNSGFNVLTTSEEGVAYLFNIINGLVIHTFDNFTSGLVGGGIVGETFVLCSTKKISFFDSEYKEVSSINVSRASCFTTIGLNDIVAAVSDSKGNVQLVQLTNNKLTLVQLQEKPHLRGVLSLTVSDDKKSLVSTCFGRTISVWNIVEMSLTCSFKTEKTYTKVLLLNDTIVCATKDSPTVQIFTTNGKNINENTIETGIESICKLSAESCLAFCTDYTMQLISLSKSETTLEQHKDWIKCIAVSTSSAEVATGDISGRVVVWNSNTGEKLRSFSCENYVGHLFVFSIDGKFLLSRVGAWDSETGIRVPYMDIKKPNRHPLKKDFQHTLLKGYMNLVEMDDSICFSANSSDSVLKATLEKNEHRKENIAVCCAGKSVHFLQIT